MGVRTKAGKKVMGKDLVRVRELYAGWQTEDLMKAITVDKADYELTAINIIKEELQSRNVTTEDLDSFHKNYIREEESLRNGGKLFCLKKRDYFFIGKSSFWCIIGYGFYFGLSIGSGKGKRIELIPFALKSEWLFILEVVFNIATFGIFPLIFFIIYSLKLSPEQRKERRLSLLMPKYIFFIYGVSLFLFFVLVILPRWGF